jgi:hypothetical protein
MPASTLWEVVMRLGKLLSVGEVTEAAEVAGPEAAGEPVPPASAGAVTGDGVRDAPAAAQLSR